MTDSNLDAVNIAVAAVEPGLRIRLMRYLIPCRVWFRPGADDAAKIALYAADSANSAPSVADYGR